MFDEQPDGDPHGECAAEINRLGLALSVATQPVDMILYCPYCGAQHIDAAEYVTDAGTDPVRDTWDNPPHKSHLCHGCGCIWRPADVPTNGVATLQTRGKADTWRVQPGPMSGAFPVKDCPATNTTTAKLLQEARRMPVGLTDNEVVAIYLAWDSLLGVSHADLGRMAVAAFVRKLAKRPELTDAEVDAIVEQQWGEGLKQNQVLAHRAAARAIEQATVTKQTAGASALREALHLIASTTTDKGARNEAKRVLGAE